MDDKRDSRFLLSGETSYSMTTRTNHSPPADPAFNSTATSSLIGGAQRHCSPSYGTRGDTGAIERSQVTTESSTPEADRMPLLSEKIIEKKQG